jgi:tetratricopeptide (TPR) repeat protein
MNGTITIKRKELKIWVILSIFFLMGIQTPKAQTILPDQSPFSRISQKIGLNEVYIEYSRPSVSGRVIFGSLLPYGKVWRVGANPPTKMYFKEEVIIEDEYKLSAGFYWLYAIPDKKEWTLIIVNDERHDPQSIEALKYSEFIEGIRFNVPSQHLHEQVESFTIQFANVCSNCSEVQLLWDFTKVSFRISTEIDEQILSEIEKFTTNPESRLADQYFFSAKYYVDTNRDLGQALKWIDKALGYEPDAYWVIHTKAEILAKMGKYGAAIRTGNQSRRIARKYNDDHYVRINDQEIVRWKELRKR